MLKLPFQVNVMRILSLLIIGLLAACSSLGENGSKENDDLYVLTSSLLAINSDRNTYIDKEGVKKADSLKNFKELEKIYIKYIESDFSHSSLGRKRLKIVMLFSFYANERNSAAISEYLAADLTPIFLAHYEQFINVFSELPFLIKSNCRSLSSSIGFEGSSIITKNDFKEKFLPVFQRSLSESQIQECFAEFDWIYSLWG